MNALWSTLNVCCEAVLGGPEDLEIELVLRQLWGITAEDGAYINGEFAALPKSQAIEDLFPSGVPALAGLADAA